MRLYLILAFMVAGCGNASSNESRTTNGYVIPANGDPQNYTWNGFPQHRYAACGRYIELSKPFEVVSSGWGTDPITIPLSYLADSSTAERAPEGSDYNKIVTFGFPSKYRGEGMWEWHSRFEGQRFVRSVANAVSILGSDEAKRSQRRSGITHFQGMAKGHSIAMTCTATNWPNPYCEIEVALGIKEQRFFATLSPTAVSELDRIVEIGAELFSDVAPSCTPNSPPRMTEIKVIRPSMKDG